MFKLEPGFINKLCLDNEKIKETILTNVVFSNTINSLINGIYEEEFVLLLMQICRNYQEIQEEIIRFRQNSVEPIFIQQRGDIILPYQSISNEKREELCNKLESRRKEMTPEKIEEIKQLNQEAKKEAEKYLEELKICAERGSKLALETLEYWENTWKHKLYNEGMYRSVAASFKETLEAIQDGKYD